MDNIEILRHEFESLLEQKNFDYSHPDVIKKGLELEKLLYNNPKNTALKYA